MSNPTTTPIALPARADGLELVLKLNDTHNPMDVGFATQVKGDKTKTKPPVDAVLVDHGVVENSKGNAALRCLFIVLKGQDFDGKDLAGRDFACDLSFSGDGADYTAANLRLMGFDFADVDAAAKTADAKQMEVAEAAFLSRLNDPAKSGGTMVKLVNVKLEQDEFKGTVYRRLALGGISQPMARLDAAATKTKLGGLFKTLVASKDGPPKRDNDAKSGPRNPTSPPPVQSGSVKDSDPIPF